MRAPSRLHAPAVMQDELGVGNVLHLDSIVVREHVPPFPEPCCRNSDLIS